MKTNKLIPRRKYMAWVREALARSPVVAVLGPRQCGKTTLAREVAKGMEVTFFDLESPADLRQLENPEYVLGRLSGLVVIDEIQLRPDLFSILRVLVDREYSATKFLILGSASPTLVKGASQSLAGRIEFVDLQGFLLSEVGTQHWEKLWIRGGFPRSFLAANDRDSLAWREGFLQTYLQRDLPELGLRIPSVAMRRFWTLLAHMHGHTWNASILARAMGLSDKTVRGYLDILTDTYMVRQLQPWFVNVSKRQIKAPKIYFRDTGLLHALLALADHTAVISNPVVGFSWEGFVLEQVIRLAEAKDVYFWGTYGGAELDLLIHHNGKRWGVEIKFSDAPKITASMRQAYETLSLDGLWIIAPVDRRYSLASDITVCPLAEWSSACLQ